MRVKIRDLSPGTNYAAQFRSNDGVNVSEWSQVQRFTTTNDLVHPANVLNLSWSDTGGSYIAIWDKVVLNQDGTPFKDFLWYHVQVTDGTIIVDYTVTQERFTLSRDMNVAAFGVYKNGLTVKVWAVDQTHNESLVAATVTASPANPPTPSTPVVSNYLGLLLVTWDGLDVGGNPMPNNLDLVEIHVSTTSGFTPTTSTLAGTLRTTSLKYVVTGLTYGTVYYIKLVAVNQSQKKSNPSTQASGSPARISGLDIANGQISAAQINFTAFDIGGANAYYPATTADRDALTGVKNGDIAYITGSGYATYRYNGTTWVAAPEIGQISGTKILAGTLTANAVGTNLLIAAAANIGNAVIDKASIASVDAATIVTSTMTATLTVSGRITTALTGARREMNAVGFQAFDASNNLTISLDGVNNLLTGLFKTALTGRRIEIGSSGSIGQINFFAPDGTQSLIQSYSATTGVEALRFKVPVTGSIYPSWNSMSLDTGEGLISTTGLASFTVGGNGPGATKGFIVYYATDRGSPTTAPTQAGRLYIDSANFTVFTQSQAEALTIGPSGSEFIYPSSNGFFRVSQLDSSGAQQAKFSILGDGGSPFVTGTYNFEWSGSAIQQAGFVQSRDLSISTKLQLIHPVNAGGGQGYGMVLRYVASSSDGFTGAHIDIRDAADTIFMPLQASAFTVPSSETIKSNIALFSDDALSLVRSAKVKKYQRSGPSIAEDLKNKDPRKIIHKPQLLPEEIGLIAEEAPDAIVVTDSNGEKAISLYAKTSLMWTAMQQMADRVDELQKEIEQLRKETKK